MFEDATARVEALTAPRNVVLVGASDRPSAWASRVWSNLSRYGYEGNVYFLNPNRTELFGRRCYPDFQSLPEAPDHLAVLVPAPAVVNALKDGAAAGARSATVFGQGFGEQGDAEGLDRLQNLKRLIDETGIALSGPNCLGNVSGKSRLVTLTHQRPLKIESGPVALVGQSGGVIVRLNAVLEERGIGVGYLITSGNEVGLKLADYIAFFARQPDIRLIACYVETVADVKRLASACELAQAAGKAVVAFKVGTSEAGREAAMAHTGALAGSAQVFDAVMGERGVIRADTLDEVIQIIELLTYARAPTGRRMAALTLSGAFRGILLDAATRNGLEFPDLARETQQRIGALLGVGETVGNPVDAGIDITSSAEKYVECLRALEADPNVDMLLLHDDLPRGDDSKRKELCIREAERYVAHQATKPVAYVTLLTQSHNDYSRAIHRELPHLPFLEEADESFRAIRGVVESAELGALAGKPGQQPSAVVDTQPAIAAFRKALRNSTGAVSLDETASKCVLNAYGIAIPSETVVRSLEEAMRAAEKIGYPVVLKAVSDSLRHKSDIGGVALNLGGRESLEAAYKQIASNMKQHAGDDSARMLVAKFVSGGIELILGLHRDPEMGLVVMMGAGGVLVELIDDVVFAAPPVSREKALHMINRARCSRLLHGYRGMPPADTAAVAEAIVALGRIAVDLGEWVEAIDINPFVALDAGKGGMALDALIIVRPRESKAVVS